MTFSNRIPGPEKPQAEISLNGNAGPLSREDPSRQPVDLRTLIRNLKESERQLDNRCSLLQAIIDGANAAIFSVDTGYRYTNFNKKHAGDMQELYGTAILKGEKLDGFVPVEKDLQKIGHLISLALAGKEGEISDYFGDNALSRRFFDLFAYPVCNKTGFIVGAAVLARDMTDRKQSEKTLLEQEEQFRRLTEDSPDFLFRVSIPEGTYEYASPAALLFTGHKPEEFYQKPGLLYDLVHSSDKDAFGRFLEQLAKGKNPPASEFQIVRGDGQVRWWFLRTTLVRDTAGRALAYEGLATDITDRKKELISIAETGEWFRTIVESADTGIVLVDVKTHVIEDANPRALAMIGAPREEVVGSPGHRFICVAADAETYPVTDTDKQVNEPEQVLHTFDGKVVPVLMTVVPVQISGRDLLIESFIDISEQKKMQDELRQSEERYRAFISNSSDGVFRFETDCEIPSSLPADEQISILIDRGHVAECNDAMARMCGYQCAEELTGQKFGIIFDSGDPCILEYLRAFIRNGFQGTDYEAENHDQDGNLRWFTTSMEGVVKDGRVIHIWGVRRDITDRKTVEISIRESGDRYRELVDHSIDIICTISFSGIITSANIAVRQLLGYQPDEFIGKNIMELFRQESRERFREEIDRKESGTCSDPFFEVDIMSNDGRFFPFEVNLRIRSDTAGDPDIIVIAREITRRKKSEDALKESEEQFRTLLQYVPSIAVQGFRQDYSVIYWNEANERMFGYTADEAAGRDIRELLFPADMRDILTETCNRMILTGIPGPSTETDLLKKDGTQVPAFVSYAVVKIPGKHAILYTFVTDLTGRKESEKALKDAGQHLQSIIDVAPFGTVVFELREDGRLFVISVSGSADRMLGTGASRILGTLEEAFPALAGDDLPAAFQKTAREGEPFSNDAFTCETGGISGVFEIHAVQLARNRVAVFVRDISEKKNAEDALAKSETRFRALIQNSPDIIQILGREKDIVYSSPAFFAILGYAERSQNCRNFIDLVHPDDCKRVTADLEGVYAGTNKGTPTEYRMLSVDGSFRYVESFGVNLLGIPGVDGIVINTHIIHERKRAEQVLQEREERFRLIFQHSNDAMYLFEITPSGMPGKIVDANDAAVRQTGYSMDELVQKSLPDISSNDLSHRSRAIMMDILTRGAARFETEKITKDGSLLPVEISARLVKFREKTCVIAISRDISGRKREERALRIANQKLQLTNIVAWHDIQNKVTGLRDYAERSRDRVTEETLKQFIDIEEDILRVISRQLRYTREYEEMGINPPQWVNIPQVMRMVVSFREIGPLAFRMELPGLEIYCDPVIEKVFSHLVENTLNHAKKATEIRISCQKYAGGLLLIYEDDGVGIPLEKKKDLFIRGAGSETGFSLFFVHDILEISDMNIRETGEPGKGVRFEISVPRGLYRGSKRGN